MRELLPAPEAAVQAAPHAWHMPDDIEAMPSMEEGEDEVEREGLAEADGFDTVDDDDV